LGTLIARITAFQQGNKNPESTNNADGDDEIRWSTIAGVTNVVKGDGSRSVFRDISNVVQRDSNPSMPKIKRVVPSSLTSSKTTPTVNDNAEAIAQRVRKLN